MGMKVTRRYDDLLTVEGAAKHLQRKVRVTLEQPSSEWLKLTQRDVVAIGVLLETQQDLGFRVVSEDVMRGIKHRRALKMIEEAGVSG
jgi:hypothetical protein